MKCIHFRRGTLLLIKPGCLHHGTTGVVGEAVLCVAGGQQATRWQQRIPPECPQHRLLDNSRHAYIYPANTSPVFQVLCEALEIK